MNWGVLLGSSVVQMNLVLDVEVGSPVADLGCTLVLRDCQHRVIIVKVDVDGSLVGTSER